MDKPRSTDSSPEVMALREATDRLEEQKPSLVALRKRIKKIGRDAGMDLEITGEFPVVKVP